MVKRKNPDLHDNMVKIIVEILEEKGYTNIKADIDGYETPGGISWKKDKSSTKRPDVTAGENGHIIFEVETEDSIDITHTEEQWKLFAAHAKNNNGEFWVIVPAGCLNQAQQKVDELGITAEVSEVDI